MKTDDVWFLPAPDKIGPVKWHPIVRVGRVVPFGYMIDPEDDLVLLPIEKELLLLEQAKKHLKQYSSRAVAAWLTEQSGRSISHVGLLKRVKLEKSRKSSSDFYKQLAERYKKALEKADELENRKLGGRGTYDSTGDSKTPRD